MTGLVFWGPWLLGCGCIVTTILFVGYVFWILRGGDQTRSDPSLPAEGLTSLSAGSDDRRPTLIGGGR